KRFLFTAWFDTGKQGKEWPGDFEIVAHEKPRTWKAAKSVMDTATGEPWIRLSLRGDRRLEGWVELSFRYRITGAEAMRVELLHTGTKLEMKRELKDLKKDEWGEMRLP